MKKAVTFRLQSDLLLAARDCAARQHRRSTDFVEVCLRDRIAEAASKVAVPGASAVHRAERANRGA